MRQQFEFFKDGLLSILSIWKIVKLFKYPAFIRFLIFTVITVTVALSFFTLLMQVTDPSNWSVRWVLSKWQCIGLIVYLTIAVPWLFGYIKYTVKTSNDYDY